MIIRFLFFLLVLGLSTAATAQEPARAPDTDERIARIRAVLAQQLARSPQDRALRFRYAQAAYQSGHFDAAKHHLRILMRSSRLPDELANLQKAYADVVDRSHWSFSGHFSLLPSTNINKTSSNIVFETPLGTAVIPDGDNEESGIGVRFGVGASYEDVLASGQTLNYNFGLTRVHFPAERLRRTDASVGLSWGIRAVGSETRINPSLLRTQYDIGGDDSSSSTRYKVRLSHERYLPKGRAVLGSLSAEYRDYDVQDHQDGPVFGAGVTYRTAVFDRFRLISGVNLTRSNPKRPHLRYTGAALSAELSWPVARLGTFGVSAGLGGREYDGDFTSFDFPRSDRFASVGVSATSPRIKIWGSSPKLSCTYQQGWSNIALYDYRSTDCALTFVRNF